MRQHDPILGVVPLKLSDILQSSSQVTRWYPLDGGIGFGRIRISLLFRSVETRLPPQQLGWDVGTFEFTCEDIVATGYHTVSKLKMRTGGSTAKIPRTQCRKLDQGDGVSWGVTKRDGKRKVRLPVRYRYRSPIIFEFHSAIKRHADAYAIIWLHHLEDNKEEDINIPIWKTDNGMRLTQNYITEENYKSIPDINIEEVGRLQFRGRFKAGTDEDHARFVSDNDSRETQETWEACNSEGVRDRVVTNELPPVIKSLHEQSLTQGRDVLAQADESEKQKWLAKDGTDWSGAFGEDPAQYVPRKSKYYHANSGSTAGKQKEGHLNEEDTGERGDHTGEHHDDSDSDTDSDSDEDDLGIRDALSPPDEARGEQQGQDEDEDANAQSGSSHAKNPIKQLKAYKESSKGLHRKQRGLMQWKPMRNLQFAKDEAKFAVKKVKNRASLHGRQPDVETEA